MTKNLLAAYFKRAFGLNFMLAAVGSALSYIFSSWGDISHGINRDVFYFFNYSQSFGVFTRLAYVFCALPFCANYANETKTKAAAYIITRSKKNAYIRSQLAVSCIAGGTALALGMFLYVGFLALNTPLFDVSADYSVGSGYDTLLIRGQAVLYYMCAVFLEFLRGSVWAAVGLCVSAYYTSVYSAIFAPITISYVYIEMAKFLKLSNLLRIDRLFSTRYPLENFYASLLIAVLGAIFMIAIIGTAFQSKAKREIANGGD